MAAPSEIILYAFHYRDSRTGKWRDARYKITPEQARKHYGEGNYELLEAHTYRGYGSTSAFLQRTGKVRNA